MRKIATAIMISLSSTMFAQSGEGDIVKNIDYFNSLKWKTQASLEVYIDKTYKLPEAASKDAKSRAVFAVVPYRHWYPYNYAYANSYLPTGFNSNVYYTNGFNMGYNSVHYLPIRLGHRRRR